MCLIGVSVRRDYQQDDPVSVDPLDFESVCRLKAVSVESYQSAASGEFGWRFRPFIEVVHNASDRAEPDRQHRKQVWKLGRQVITPRPPRSIDISGLGRLGLQSQPRGVFGRRLVFTDVGSVL